MSEWISIEDRLPEDDKLYLVSGVSDKIGKWIDCDEWRPKYSDWWRYPHGQVTHWGCPYPNRRRWTDA